MGMTLATGVEMIAREREKQISIKGFSAEHDDKHTAGQLALVAAHYANPSDLPAMVPGDWDYHWATKGVRGRIHDLAVAGALCAAEIDRLHRKGEK